MKNFNKAMGASPITISLETDPPSFDSMNLKQISDYYQAQADQLFEIFVKTLPGGVFDRLLGKMLLYKSTHFRVPHER
jgi:hypothetical protein